MILKKIFLHNFRNFSEKNFNFDKNLTVIIGDNSLGKTNLLEAIHFAVLGVGFREEKEDELISFNKEDCLVEGIFNFQKTNYRFLIKLKKYQNLINKNYFINGVKKSHWSYLKEQTNVVLFSPEQVNIIIGAPQLRREYFNKFISSYDFEYKKRLINYNNALRKRNKILEKHNNQFDLDKQLDFWNNYLEKEGEYLTNKRNAYTEFLNNNQHLDSKIFKINYIKNEFNKKRLDTVSEKEKLIRKTMIGPQKDDFIINISNDKLTKDVHHFGSRSEQRLAIFWLKINELKYFDENFQKKSLLLLDDIFSELDVDNKKLIFSLITKYQTVATTTEDKLINKIKIPKKIIQL